MKSTIIGVLFFCCCFHFGLAQDPATYRIFSHEGKEVSFDKMMRTLTKADVVFFGEIHNDPIGHWLQLQVFRELYAKNNDLVLAMEMFEADDQIVLNEYLQGIIQEKHLLSEAKVWDNYKTDYRSLIEFAKGKKLKVVASNIPRRYANLVYRHGLSALDSLSDEAKKWIASLPIEVDLSLPNYKALLEGMSGHEGSGSNGNMANAQAIKDATMAYFIRKSHPSKNQVFHVNGAYHSQDGEGIIWYLKKADASLEMATIHVAQQEDISELDSANKNKADFIICVPADMVQTK